MGRWKALASALPSLVNVVVTVALRPGGSNPWQHLLVATVGQLIYLATNVQAVETCLVQLNIFAVYAQECGIFRVFFVTP
jgi:uncharacterized membrane protein HdeD (DUF308 family)